MISNKGFTLIELLVVVLIIGILAAISLPQYQVTAGKSRITPLVSILRSIDTAQQVYKMANGVYASNLTDLDVQIPAADANFSYSQYIDGNGNVQSISGYDQRTNVRIGKYYTDDYFICWAYPQSAKYTLQKRICQVVSGSTQAYPVSGNEYYIIK